LYDKPSQQVGRKNFIKNGETYRNVSEIQNFILALCESGVNFVKLVKHQQLEIRRQFVKKGKVCESNLLPGGMFLKVFHKANWKGCKCKMGRIANLSTTMEGTFSPSATTSWKCKVPDNSALHVLTKAFCTVFVMVIRVGQMLFKPLSYEPVGT
jgi:hypothetical protein